MKIQITSTRQSPVVTAQYATTATPPAPMWFGILRFVLLQDAPQILQKDIIIIIIIKSLCRPLLSPPLHHHHHHHNHHHHHQENVQPLLFPPLQTPTRLVLFQDHVEKLASVVFKRRKRRFFSSFFVGVKHPWVINICKFRLTPAIP